MNNPFQVLGSDSTDKSEEEGEKSEMIIDPSSELLSSFKEKILEKQISSLIELAEVIDDVISIPPERKQDYKKDFEKYDCAIEKYEEALVKRLNCFDDINESDFIAKIKEQLDNFDTIDLRPLIDFVIDSLNKNEPTGHGGLFLIGIIVNTRPDLITPKLLNLQDKNIAQVGPIVCWIVGQATLSLAIAHLDPLLSHQLIEIFLPQLMSIDKINNEISVCASHLIVRAFNGQNIMRASAAHYAKLLFLTKHTKTKRDKLVGRVFESKINEITVVDMKNLPSQIMEMFPNAPKFACEKFEFEATKKNGGNASFVDGWIEAHSKYKNVSMLYLTKVLSSLPEYVVNKFPMEDLIKGGDFAKLAAMKVQLTNSSFKFIFLCVIIGILYHMWLKKKSD